MYESLSWDSCHHFHYLKSLQLLEQKNKAWVLDISGVIGAHFIAPTISQNSPGKRRSCCLLSSLGIGLSHLENEGLSQCLNCEVGNACLKS